MSLEFKYYKINDIGEVVSGGTPSTSKNEYWYGDIGWITPKDLSSYDDIYISRGERNISSEGLNNSSAKLVPKNTVLMTSRAPIGYIAIANNELSTNQGFKSLICNEKICHYKYFYYWLKLNIKYIINNSNGSTFKEISGGTFKNLELSLPSLNEQKAMSSVLWTIDEKISVLKRINKNLLSIADAIYKKEFQNFDTYSEDELIASDFGLIPKNWHYKTLDEISDVGIGKTPPRKETWWFSEQEGVKWVSIKDLGNSGTYIFETSEYLTNEAIEKFNVKLIPINTVILSFKLTVGRIGITTEEMVTNEAIAHFKLSENSVITKEYLYLYLKNFNYEELGSTSSIAKAINSKIVKKIPILIPNNKINEFKDLFENLFNKIKSNQLEINKLTKLRDTLLPKLMSGEINVSEVNCDLKIIIRKIYIKSSKLFLWRYLSENKNYIKNTKSNETLLKSRTIYKINKFLAKFNARYRYYRQ